MKRYKRLGVLLGLLAAVCLATFALTRYEEKQEAIRASEEVILSVPSDTVQSLSWIYTTEGLAFHRDGDAWLYDEDEAFPVSAEKVAAILAHFEDFTASFTIEDVEDYSQYGLDDPACTIRLATEDQTYEIKLGDFSKMDQQRYVDIGDGNAYLVSQDPMDFVTSALSDMILHDDTPGFETVTQIQFSGAENYTITRMEDSGLSYSDADVYFTQQNGEYLPLNKSSVTQYLNTITSLDLLDYVTYNATAEELESYGLTDPELSVTVDYTYTDDEENTVSDTCVIHISRNPEELQAAQEAEAAGEAAESVTKYVRVGDSQIVYALDDTDYGILSAAGYDALRHKEVFWADMDDVYRMDITLEDTRHILTSYLDEEENRVWQYGLPAETEETAPTGETVETEPEEAETLDISALQTYLKNLYASEFTQEEPTGKEELRLTLYLENENFPQVEIVLYRYDGTSCLAQVDGESVSLLTRSSVMELVEAAQSIALDHM